MCWRNGRHFRWTVSHCSCFGTSSSYPFHTFRSLERGSCDRFTLFMLSTVELVTVSHCWILGPWHVRQCRTFFLGKSNSSQFHTFVSWPRFGCARICFLLRMLLFVVLIPSLCDTLRRFCSVGRCCDLERASSALLSCLYFHAKNFNLSCRSLLRGVVCSNSLFVPLTRF